MRSLFAFFKKELMESLRGARVLGLGLIFIALGFMNPALTLMTPWMMELLAEELGELSGVLGTLEANAWMSWTQYFKNIPMALFAFVFFYSNTFTREYNSGTLVLMLTKGLARYKVLLSKTAVMALVWSVGYWLCFGITYGCTAVLWDNGDVQNLFIANVNWWLFGMFTIALIVLFSVIFKSYVGVLMGTGGSILALYVISLLPKIAKYFPTTLMNSAALLVGAETASDYTWTIIITAILTAACIIAAIPVLNKKEIS